MKVQINHLNNISGILDQVAQLVALLIILKIVGMVERFLSLP
jgi:hypothetical protein